MGYTVPGTPPKAAPDRRPARGRRQWQLLGQLHFGVPVTVPTAARRRGRIAAVKVTLYGRLPLLQPTDTL